MSGGAAGARAVAAEVLGRWLPGGPHIEDLFAGGASGLGDPHERAFARELTCGVVRYLMLLDHVILPRAARPLDRAVRALLRLGVYQLLFTRVPPHAAVHETVALAGRAKPLVNAVLRRVEREREKIAGELASAPPWVRHSHPEFLWRRWERAFGPEEAEALCGWNNRPAELFVRANGLRIAPEELAGKLEAAGPVPGFPGMFRVGRLPAEALAEGLCYVQDPATMVACGLLGARPGERVLDACAAPGGKSFALAEAMGGSGEIVACDADEGRLGRLAENAGRLGIGCVKPLLRDWMADAGPVPLGVFDRILLDAPCTNSGVMRRRVDARWRVGEGEFARMAALQLELLRRVSRFLAPGGVLVYSTCSIDAEENAETVRRFLAERPDLALAGEEARLPFRDGTDGAYAARIVVAASAGAG